MGLKLASKFDKKGKNALTAEKLKEEVKTEEFDNGMKTTNNKNTGADFETANSNFKNDHATAFDFGFSSEPSQNPVIVN